MSIRMSTRAVPTKRQRVYYLYLLVVNGVEYLNRATRNEVSVGIDTQNGYREANGVPFKNLTMRQMLGETLGLVAEQALSGEES